MNLPDELPEEANAPVFATDSHTGEQIPQWVLEIRERGDGVVIITSDQDPGRGRP